MTTRFLIGAVLCAGSVLALNAGLSRAADPPKGGTTATMGAGSGKSTTPPTTAAMPATTTGAPVGQPASIPGAPPAATPPPPPPPSGQIEIKEDSWDYGWTPEGYRVGHGFLTKNTGKDTLHITNVRPGCGCTSAPLKKADLAANDTQSIVLQFNTHRFNAKVTKSATVQSTAANAPSLAIKFSANMDSTSYTPIKSDPKAADFGVGKDAKKEATVKIKNMTDKKLPLKLVGIYGVSKATLKKNEVPAKGEVELTITLPDAPKEAVCGAITIEAGDSLNSRLTVPISGGAQ